MTRSLRSTVTLPGDISNYLLDSSDSMATGGGEETNGVNLQSMVHELSGDPTKLCELLVKNLTIANESNQKMQELLRDRQGQSNTRQNPSFVSKLDECPTKGKYSSLDAWVQEVQLWDQSNSNGSDIESLNTKKYLKFMTSVNNSENCDDLKKLVQVEFKENKDFNKKSNTIIEDMLKVIKEKLDKTDLEKCSEAWVNFINIKQEVSESAAAYVVRFEQVETQLKNVKIVIPNRALAIHLLNKSCLAAQSKENVLTKTNLEDDSEIYSTLKKSVREMKSTLTQNEVLEVKDNNTNSVVAKRENDTYYAGKERGHFKRNVRSKDRNNSYKSRNSDKRTYSNRDHRSRTRDNRPWQRGRYRSKSDNGRAKDNRNRSDRSYSRHERRKSDSRGGRHEARRTREEKSSSDEEVNNIHLTTYEYKDTYDIGIVSDSFSEDKSNIEFLELVYSEGTCTIDPYKLVVDSACPKTVTGKSWMDAYIESKDDFVVKRRKENEFFKFGPSKVFNSKENYEIEVNIGKLKDTLKVSVVDADIPLLLGLDYQAKWGVIIDIGNQELTIRKSNETFKISSEASHWTLPIQGNKKLHDKAYDYVYHTSLEKLDDKELRKSIMKIHKNLSHKSENQLLKLFKMAGKDTKTVRKMLKNVIESCNVCKRYKKTPPRPRVALAKASSINEIVSVDLKEKGSRYILYMCDEFSGYMVAEVISNKNPETVLTAFNKKWVLEGPGIPSRGIFADNGGEFKNPAMKEAAAKFNISLSLTAGRSPWSNGKNEREHYTCDLTVEKMMEDDSTLKLEEAVRLAVYAKNLQVNRTGFSPRQLMFGHQGVVPGIIDGNPASMEPIIESDTFRKEFINRQKAEETFRQYDANERIQKVLAQRAYGYDDIKYSEGEKVLFKEEGKNRWTGPGKVTGMEGSKVRIVHAGYDRTVPACRVIPYNDPVEIVDTQAGASTNLQPSTNSVIALDLNNLEPSLSENSLELRPKLYKNILYKVEEEDTWRRGKVSKVGKKNGKDRFRVWLDNCNGPTLSYDFKDEIAAWKYLNVEFNEDTQDNSSKNTARNENLHMGVWYLQHKDKLDSVNDDIIEHETFAVEIPKKYHAQPDIFKAKVDELNKWQKYGAYEEVAFVDQHVISTRWVITEKDDTSVKARLVVRGFEEKDVPQSDSPTAHKESCKLFLAICANERFQLKSLDVTSAFLQGQPLEREVFVSPPAEARKEGVIWKLKKTCYGLYDASRSWYFAVKEQIEKLGMKTLSGDSSFFYLIKEGKLEGLCILHVDDFLIGGKPEFFDLIKKEFMNKFTFGKVQCQKFKYTGLNIEQSQDGTIHLDQNEYIQSLQPISIEKPVDKNKKLSKYMFKKYRALTGQLSWAAEMTRPDLCFDARELSSRNKDATYADIKKANKILKKAQKEDVSIKFSHLGNLEDLKITAFTDSSYRNCPNKIKSIGGRYIALTNQVGNASPLIWKSKTIQQVCKSVKTAETRSLERGVEDAIYLARMLQEIYTGQVSEDQIPVDVKIDSKTLLDSLNSTKQVDEKTIRHLIAWLKEQLFDKKVKQIDWVCSEEMIADVFTKANVKSDLILEVVREGKFNTF